MHYDQINRTTVTDYASIAHGMPEYRVMSGAEIDRHLALAMDERSKMTMSFFRNVGRRIAGLFGNGKTSAA